MGGNGGSAGLFPGFPDTSWRGARTQRGGKAID